MLRNMNKISFKNIIILFFVLIISNCKLINKTDKKLPPKYGNYCLFDQTIKNFSTIPEDKTDLACKNYHKCLKKTKTDLSNCNNQLIDKLKEIQKLSEIETTKCQKIIHFLQEK